MLPHAFVPADRHADLVVSVWRMAGIRWICSVYRSTDRLVPDSQRKDSAAADVRQPQSALLPAWRLGATDPVSSGRPLGDRRHVESVYPREVHGAVGPARTPGCSLRLRRRRDPVRVVRSRRASPEIVVQFCADP
jgi:hypothetical protein